MSVRPVGSALKSYLLKWRAMNPQLKLFLIGILLFGVATGIFDISFNNFLSDEFQISAKTRGWLEFPRETPGFLTALFVGMLFFVSETRIAAIAALLTGLALISVALWGHHWVPMVVLMTLCSTGVHLFLPVRGSISMLLAQRGQHGRRLGQVGAVQFASGIIGSGMIWMVFRMTTGSYTLLFILGGLIALAASVLFFMMRVPDAHLQRPKWVWNRQYWLFYVMAILFGGRKQIFLTFGPWVLIREFHQSAAVFAQLWVIGAVGGLFFQPLLGTLIDRWGERKVLIIDSISVMIVCMGYAYSHWIPNQRVVLATLFVCYIADQLLFGMNIARSTYMSKIAINPTHIAPSLSMGSSLDHVVSMTIPVAGGLLWASCGYQAVFLAAAGIAVLMLIFSAMIRLPESRT